MQRNPPGPLALSATLLPRSSTSVPVPVRLPVPALGAALGVVLVAAGAVLGWAQPAWSEPGYRHAPYLAVAPLSVVAFLLVALRPSRRTCLAAMAGGFAVALVAKGSVWSAGRVVTFVGGSAIVLAGAAGYRFGPTLDLRTVEVERPSPPVDGWLALLGAVGVAGLTALVTTPSADGILDVFGGLFLAATILGLGATVALYRWGPDLRVAVLGFPVVLPALLLATPLARLVHPVAGFLVAALAVGVTCLLGVGLTFAGSASYIGSLVGPPVALRHEQGRPLSHVRTLPLVVVTAGLSFVLLAGLLPWHANVLRLAGPSPLPEAGVGVPGYYLVLGLATAAFLVGVVRWTVPSMRVVVALGLLVAVFATGQRPLDGGRLVATAGGLLLALGGLIADCYGRDVGPRTLVPGIPPGPTEGWIALAGWLLTVGPLPVFRTAPGSSTALVRDPFVREGPVGVYMVAVGTVERPRLGALLFLAVLVLVGVVVCLYLWHPDVGVALALVGLAVGGWCGALLVDPGLLTAHGLLVVRLTAVGTGVLVVAGGLSLVGGSGDDSPAG
jgi:hypothetical protein